MRTHHVLGSHLRAIHASSVVPKYGAKVGIIFLKDPKLNCERLIICPEFKLSLNFELGLSIISPKSIMKVQQKDQAEAKLRNRHMIMFH